MTIIHQNYARGIAAKMIRFSTIVVKTKFTLFKGFKPKIFEQVYYTCDQLVWSEDYFIKSSWKFRAIDRNKSKYLVVFIKEQLTSDPIGELNKDLDAQNVIRKKKRLVTSDEDDDNSSSRYMDAKQKFLCINKGNIQCFDVASYLPSGMSS